MKYNWISPSRVLLSTFSVGTFIVSAFFVYSLLFSKISYADEGIEATLDTFHQAASEADSKTYFDLLTQDSIFLGTDATERWTKKEFKAFAEPYFSQGKGWTYQSTQRHISVLADGKTAFFDELLSNNSYGECRGSGVLVLTEQGWKIAQYNLSIPIPNDLSKTLTEQIKNFQTK